MIITQITGGIGNQLFQFAAGFTVAKRLNTKLALHFALHKLDTKRKPAIAELLPEMNWVTDNEAAQLIPSNTIGRFWQRILPFRNKRFYKEPYFHFDPNLMHITDHTYLKGYWQSEKYFLQEADLLRITLLDAFSRIELSSELSSKLSEENSISVHIRKGDYLKAPYNTFYHQLTNDYYQKAIQKLEGRVYVFTDDVDWVQNNLDIDLPFEIVSGFYTNSMFEDMKAMMLCHHHVLANSSFSWWTAWLSHREHKIVIAPDKWFHEGPSDTQDLIPESWIKL